VIKNTGDGLLISFESALDAVSFALEAQRTFSSRNESLSLAERLDHRMGIHLGDVFLTESDAMGDGVNIASRLQSEAEPGGICISQTVYDVVKNKLAINAVSLGPRELKNIRDAIYAYRIIVDAECGASPIDAAAERRRAVGAKIAAFSIIALALIIIARTAVVRRARRPEAPAGPPQSEIPPTAPESRDPRARFDGAPPGNRGEAPPLADDIRSARLSRMRQRLSAYTQGNPLIIHLPRRPDLRVEAHPPRDTAVWMEGEHVVMQSGDEITRRPIDRLPPRALRMIGIALAREEKKQERMPPR